MRKLKFEIGEYYHIYNRGTDKRIIFTDYFDLLRFIQSVNEFNTLEPIGSIWENKNRKEEFGNGVTQKTKLVDIVCYCFNPNHYHFILTPLVDNGIEKFMHKLGSGFTRYFNGKYDRTGVLFQGPFKAIHIDSDEYLMYLSGYINLNNKIHKFGNGVTKNKNGAEKVFWKSSWDEYLGKNEDNFCNKSIILDRFKGKIKDYKEFAEDVAQGIIEKRYEKDLVFDKALFLE